MSKFTTTVYDYLQSELQNKGLNEFYNDNRLTFFDDKYAFMQKVLTYDKDVDDIVTMRFFKGFAFTNKSVDKDFKKTFITRFMDREFNRQTVEAFASQVVATTIQHHEYIEYVFKELEKFMSGESTYEDESKEDTTSTDEHREANATLPQNEVNINVDNDELDFADENKIWKDKHTSNNNKSSKGKKNNYNPDNLEKVFDMKERIFEEFDRRCFLQIW